MISGQYGGRLPVPPPRRPAGGGSALQRACGDRRFPAREARLPPLRSLWLPIRPFHRVQPGGSAGGPGRNAGGARRARAWVAPGRAARGVAGERRGALAPAARDAWRHLAGRARDVLCGWRLGAAAPGSGNKCHPLTCILPEFFSSCDVRVSDQDPQFCSCRPGLQVLCG